MKRNWLYVIVIVAVTLSVWGGLSAKRISAAPVDFTIWNFDAGNTVPSTDLTGSATATGGPGLGTVAWVQGNPTTGLSWSYPSWSTATLDTTDYFEFQVNLTNYGHITLGFDERRSATGIRDFEVQYSTDGTNFTQIPATVTNVPDDTNWRSHIYDLGAGTAIDLAIRGQSNVYFRIYGYTAEAGTGTWRIDNVRFNASTNPTAVTMRDLTASSPASPAPIAFGVLGLTAAALLLRRRAIRSTTH